MFDECVSLSSFYWIVFRTSVLLYKRKCKFSTIGQFKKINIWSLCIVISAHHP
jgi:hypothetical protein